MNTLLKLASSTGGESIVHSYYLACVWCFMVFKWSMLLLVNSIIDDRTLPREEVMEMTEKDGKRTEKEFLLP